MLVPKFSKECIPQFLKKSKAYFRPIRAARGKFDAKEEVIAQWSMRRSYRDNRKKKLALLQRLWWYDFESSVTKETY